MRNLVGAEAGRRSGLLDSETAPGGELRSGAVEARRRFEAGDSSIGSACQWCSGARRTAVRRSGGSDPATPLIGGEDISPGAAGETSSAGPS
ncbi:hypothetical protein NDU88_008172 [Pleurodeles waltl]|uniref:Uncharacterized protein n=1 Tax=Pleurodeles waltl TaxID=8319 RepID=A0AAV7SUX6_PLEWA|nr:hypothetical protein NDU88_008172 [Pleurodeles waltl]